MLVAKLITLYPKLLAKFQIFIDSHQYNLINIDNYFKL